ncbi:hypothetical protein [Microbacterium terricola]|nr:hypothetical protein [Microbacterium terricola]UYK38971.1 hypothetical protein OAU46_09645 [Microbacterium terricola]
MAEYDTDPVWDEGGGIELASLPLSQELSDELRTWGEEYFYNDGRSPFESFEAEKNWVVRGKKLADRVQQELGAGYAVSYGEQMPKPPKQTKKRVAKKRWRYKTRKR